MKFSAAALLLAPVALAAGVPKVGGKSYDGYKAYRISTEHDVASVKDKIAPFSAVQFNYDTQEHLDVAIAPEDVAAFEALDLTTRVMSEDLGAEFAEEGKFGTYESEFLIY